ncbi:MAG: hypothetical protein H6765_07695 [Candidatus Peribacteria bacterium]|nr:MAG: hypothetical protein H6765_07695 [Candidatus Peribacteria bacterium]
MLNHLKGGYSWVTEILPESVKKKLDDATPTFYSTEDANVIIAEVDSASELLAQAARDQSLLALWLKYTNYVLILSILFQLLWIVCDMIAVPQSRKYWYIAFVVAIAIDVFTYHLLHQLWPIDVHALPF